ncbi:hypothetical protein ACP0HM_02600 [Escherichia coli]
MSVTLPCAAAGTVRRDLLSREVTMSQDALLAALRLSAGSPGAALALFQGDNWQARETLCQALAYSVHRATGIRC